MMLGVSQVSARQHGEEKASNGVAWHMARLENKLSGFWSLGWMGPRWGSLHNCRITEKTVLSHQSIENVVASCSLPGSVILFQV